MSKLYSKDPIGINLISCSAAGEILSPYKADIEESIWSNWDIEDIFAFKVIFISICHDINWDYLQNSLARIFDADRSKLTAQYLKNLKASTLQKWLDDYEKPERIRAKERAELVRDIGAVIDSRYGGKIYNLYLKSDKSLFGERGLYRLLDEFEAYRRDELKKKSNVLTHDLVRENIIIFPDIREIKPAIEYHIMRLYGRTGRILFKNASFLTALITGELLEPRHIKIVREATSDALVYTAGAASLSVPDVNYIEWQIARNICKKDKPNCITSKRAPQSLPPDVKNLFKGSCPYMKFCFAYSHPELRLLKEPKPEYRQAHY